MNQISKGLLGIVFLCCIGTIKAQDLMISDSSNIHFSEEVILQNVLNNEFSRLITGNSLSGLGNYAAINTVDNTLKAGINIVNDCHILGISISGGATDGILNIASDSKLNSNVSLGFNIHKLSKGSNGATYVTSIDKINDETKSILHKYVTDSIAAHNYLFASIKALKEKEKALTSVKSKISKRKSPNLPKLSTLNKHKLLVEQEIKVLISKKEFYTKKINQDSLIEIAKQKRDDSNNKDPFKKETFTTEKLKIEAYGHFYDTSISKKKKELNLLNNEIEGYGKNLDKLEVLEAEKIVIENSIKILNANQDNYDIYVTLGELANKMEADLQENWKGINKIKATDLDFTWTSFGVEVSYQSFSLFDATRPEDNQIYVEKDLVPKFFISYSGYLNKPLLKRKKKIEKSNSKNNQPILVDDIEVKHIRYYSFGFNGKYGNNSANLELVEIKDTETVSDMREIIRVKKAYVGDFKEEEMSGQIFGEYYQFVGNKNNIGFHIKGTIDVGAFRPITSVRTGLLIPFINAKDTKSNVNLEFFFGLNDIFSNTSKHTLLGRNVFGVQATLPLNFKL